MEPRPLTLHHGFALQANQHYEKFERETRLFQVLTGSKQTLAR